MRKALLHLNHSLIHSLLKSNMVVCDMTCGHGHDTSFIAPKVRHVYAFDIQKKAIESAQETLKDVNNVTLIHDSFIHVHKYVSSCELFVFNLGYLPQSDKLIKTTKDVTLQALENIHMHYPKASIIMMSYVGHKEGSEEYIAVKAWLQHTDHYKTIESKLMEHPNAPILLWIYPK